MELRELLVIDPEALTPSEAKQVAQDAIRVLANGVSASDQGPLKSLLIAAEEKVLGRKVGEPVETKGIESPRGWDTRHNLEDRKSPNHCLVEGAEDRCSISDYGPIEIRAALPLLHT